jgi:hypothetical protein
LADDFAFFVHQYSGHGKGIPLQAVTLHIKNKNIHGAYYSIAAMKIAQCAYACVIIGA